MPAGRPRASSETADGAPTKSASELIPGFVPESDLERRVSEDPALLEGLAWGRPRSGHPEGSVGAHVADLLETLERWGEPEPRRGRLRFVSLVHDSLKYQVRQWLPRTGENHHAMRARRFAEGYTGDERLLTTIELHDKPYAIWRRMPMPRRRAAAVDELVRRLADPALFMRFVELDGSTEGKSPEPIAWFRGELARRRA